jgi:hypothetical protein
MTDRAIHTLNSTLEQYPWLPQLANILPLSALLDFINVPSKLHVFQLVGGVPIWSWPITPAGSRILLASKPTEPPYLDCYGNSVSLVALDGRYGDHYFITSPETFRVAVDSVRPERVHNLHPNMNDEDLRFQQLEVIHVTRIKANYKDKTIKSAARTLMWQRFLPDHWSAHSSKFWIVSFAGWVTLGAIVVATILLRLYIATAFLALMPATGFIVYAMYGTRPRRLLVNDASAYNRLVVVAEHMNSTHWTIVYGESTLVNSLLNRPLEPINPKGASPKLHGNLQFLLSVLILGQWAMAIAAAATANWNSFFLCFWVFFCIVIHSYILPPTVQVKDWLKSCAKVELQRYQTQVSSRRALLNTIVALNPDTFAVKFGEKLNNKIEDRTQLFQEGMRWIDPILKESDSRTRWEGATREALNESSKFSLEELATDARHCNEANQLSSEWNRKYQGRECYWKKFIPEGIYVAAKIRLQGRIPGRELKVPAELI